MSEQGTWARVSKDEPCGICEKPDWCTRGEKGWACMRVESEKMLKNGGWWHPFDTAKPMPPPPRPAKAKPPTPNFGEMMRGWAKAVAPQFAATAKEIGVSAESLQWLGAVWSEERAAMAFPMYDATCHNGSRPIGIRLRTQDGKKFAVTGSSSGIFYPYRAVFKISPFDRLYICEGPTDTAAALDMGCFAIGRAACRGGEGFVLSVLEQLCPDEVVIVTDNDGPGVTGAKDLLRHIQQPKLMLTPPGKDLRSFHQAGGSKIVLEDMLKNTIRR